MDKFIRIVYESADKNQDGNGAYVTSIKTDLVPFSEVEYSIDIPYEDNMMALIEDIMSVGFVKTITGKFISVFRIYSFEAYQDESKKVKMQCSSNSNGTTISQEPSREQKKQFSSQKRFKKTRKFHNHNPNTYGKISKVITPDPSSGKANNNEHPA